MVDDVAAYFIPAIHVMVSKLTVVIDIIFTAPLVRCDVRSIYYSRLQSYCVTVKILTKYSNYNLLF